ncbi:RNA polymerase sigma factor [Saccharothrix algeriensis]|uniref:RNA polymerase sigma factor (Sigma-70 family) n=1 Tax=Saccharothrix algeriensis TaxID=173560 RepID=A0A8T8HUJ5_9PSEU|nr:sigma-70 family RNA polymerase sigma factor [Saccharothrix algeriensis]MBM7813566.1 RNA polymerase sigma factor (sigma-70 family) [Saccharothrix algeriensis]QTR02061.1 sigma-70 family RNA polymerase sigma factor [Saccharothrix algeriensis]
MTDDHLDRRSVAGPPADLDPRLDHLRAELTEAIPDDPGSDDLGVAAIIAQGAPAASGPERHAALLTAARTGDRGALDRLVAELTPLVWHVARGNGLDRSTAEDVVQTVWLSLLRHLDRIAEPRALAGWLIVTTRREAHRAWREANGRAALSTDSAADVPDTRWLPETEALRDDRDRRLWRAFAALPRRCQELLRLTVLAGRAEYRAVAEALSMPRGSIGPTRGRCLTALRTRLEREGGA